MKKFLDIFLIVIITFLLVNMFGSFNEKESQKTGLNIEFSGKNYTIPASVGINISNYTDSSVSLNTCSDLNILKSGEKIKFSDDFCKQIELKPKEVKKIDYASEYSKFTDFWEYTLKAKIWEKEYFSQFNLENKGSISKIFTSLVYSPIYNLVAGLILLFSGSFGWAVVWVTIIIRIVLLYPQHKMMISQRKLQAIQPKIKEVQEKYKNDKQKLWLEIMNLYKKEKVNPFGSCWFLLIQMPILLVIYNIILWIQNPANIYYVYDFLGSFHLADINFNFFGLELLKSWWVQGIILAVLIAVIQFIQIKLSLSNNSNLKDKNKPVLEKKKWENDYSNMMPDPEMMNKFMLYWMPLMVWVFTYTLFAWVWIYWWISTLFMLFQQLIVNKIVKKSS